MRQFGSWEKKYFSHEFMGSWELMGERIFSHEKALCLLTINTNTLLQRKENINVSQYQPIYGGEKAVDGIYLPPNGDETISIAHSQAEGNPW